jgi:hypothetical protein
LLADRKAGKEWAEGFFDRVDPETGAFKQGLVGNFKRKAHKDIIRNVEKAADAGLITDDQADAMLSEARKRMLNTKASPVTINDPRLKKLWGGVTKAHDAAVDMGRENMFSSPGYAVQNIKDDLNLGWIGGGDTFRGWKNSAAAKMGKASDVLFQDDLGRPIAKGDFLKAKESQGIVGATDRLSEGGRKFSPQDIERKIYGGSSDNLAQKFGTGVNLGFNKVGKKIASLWDDSHRSALFAEFIQQGLPPKLAAQKVDDLAFNYLKPGMFPAGLKVAKAFNPYIGWGYRAATRVPKAALANPVRANVLPTAARAIGGEAPYKDDPTPGYLKRELVVPLPEGAKNIFNAAAAKIGLKGIPEGQGMKTTVRNPQTGAAGAITGFGEERGLLGSPVANLAKTAVFKENALGQKYSSRADGIITEGLKLIGGKLLPRVSEYSAAKFNTPDYFREKDKVSFHPERDTAISIARWATGETIVPTTATGNSMDLLYDEKQKERVDNLQRTKGQMADQEVINELTREQMIDELRARGILE